MENSISDESDNSDFETSYQERSVNGYPLCRGCNKEIFDKYYLRVNEASWHEECLKCNYCSQTLVSEETCFIKKRKIFCKIDYYKNFGIKCAKCCRNIQSSDWVRRAKDNVYHLACFACENCKRQLSTGEEFALQNNKVLCKTHYCEIIDGENGKEENSKSKNKRVRTTFTEEQLQILQANFEIDSNPDGQDLERIAQTTGLSKRVTQVWFQNSRARQKKYKEKKIENGCLDVTNDTSNDSNDDDMWSNSDFNPNISSKSCSNNNNVSHQYHQLGVFDNSSELAKQQLMQHKQEKSESTKQSRSSGGLKFKNNELNMSWASGDSSDEEGNENSMYGCGSSMDYNND